MAGVRCWLFTGRMCEVLQLASMWSGRQCVDVDVYAIEDAPIDRTAAQMRSESFAIVLATALGQHVGPLPLAEFLRGSLDTRYRLLLEPDRVRVEWDTGRATTPPVAEEDDPRR